MRHTAAQHGSGFDHRRLAEPTDREHQEMKAAYYATLEANATNPPKKDL